MPPAPVPLPTPARDDRPLGYVWAIAICLATTGVEVALRGVLAEANLALLYLLAVIVITFRFGRGPGIAASVVAVLAFDLFLVQPYFSITVADSQYLLTLALMLAVSLMVSHLGAGLQAQAALARQREERAAMLFALSQALASAHSETDIGAIAATQLGAAFGERTVLLLPGPDHQLHPVDTAARIDAAASRLATVVFMRPQDAEAGIVTSAGVRYLPLRAPERTRGVLLLFAAGMAGVLTDEQERLLQTCAAQIALAIERVHYAEAARAAMVSVEAERLRNTLLSALSHDLRTPLTSIRGLAGAIASGDVATLDGARDAAQAVHDQAVEMTALVTNLLHMARLQAGPVELALAWQMIEEVAGSALAQMARPLANVAVAVDLPPTLPLVAFDAVLIERVLCNLLDNAAKFGARSVRLAARARDGWLEVTVDDTGPGFADGGAAAAFVTFARGRVESAQVGAGLGLAICKAIVEAHGGAIRAGNRSEGGARVAFTLPLGTPPALTDEGVHAGQVSA